MKFIVQMITVCVRWR